MLNLNKKKAIHPSDVPLLICGCNKQGSQTLGLIQFETELGHGSTPTKAEACVF